MKKGGQNLHIVTCTCINKYNKRAFVVHMNVGFMVSSACKIACDAVKHIYST